MPTIVDSARANRAFLRRAVRFLAAEAGIRQFLDIGTGIPTSPNVHEIAQAIAPESRIVYVDNDPIVLVHARALLTSTPEGVTGYVDADLRDPDRILATAARTLDFEQPIALTLLTIVQLIPDADDPYAIVERLVEALPGGSYLLLSQPANDVQPEGAIGGRRASAAACSHRSRCAARRRSRASSTAWSPSSLAWSRSTSGVRTPTTSTSNARCRSSAASPASPEPSARSGAQQAGRQRHVAGAEPLAERLGLRVEAPRLGGAAVEQAVHHEVQRPQVGQLVAVDHQPSGLRCQCAQPLGGHGGGQPRPGGRVADPQAQVRVAALVP